MASPCEIIVETDDETRVRRMTETAATEVWRIEDKFSRYNPESVVSGINSGRTVTVDEETGMMLDFASHCYELSGGLFDVTSGIFRKIWKFDGSGRIPAERKIKSLLKMVGWDKVSWAKPTITLARGMEIDLGGIGKEYAVDRVLLILKEEFQGAFLVNLGGDVAAHGKRKDGQPWAVGIENPSRTGSAKIVLPLISGALATSGDCFRYVSRNGIRYGHIINPKTGWPEKDAPRSVTVMDDTCTNAGILATLAMLHGKEAENFLAAENVRYWAVRE
jgi:thiamine biosynthesis lipoprotein